ESPRTRQECPPRHLTTTGRPPPLAIVRSLRPRRTGGGTHDIPRLPCVGSYASSGREQPQSRPHPGESETSDLRFSCPLRPRIACGERVACPRLQLSPIDERGSPPPSRRLREYGWISPGSPGIRCSPRSNAMISRALCLLGLSALPLVAAGELPSASLSSGMEGGNGGTPTRAKLEHPSPQSPGLSERLQDPEDPPRLQQRAEVDFCVGLNKLLEASANGFRSVTQAFKETPTGVLVGLGTVQLPGAVLCTAVQHLVSGAWKASYTCHFAADDETVPKAEADRRLEALKQQTRSCIPAGLKERDSTGGEDLGVVSTSFVGDPSGPTVTVFLNYNGGSAEHPSTIDLWLSVVRSLP